MVNNAQEARRMSDSTEDPKLEQVLQSITAAAAEGKYSIIPTQPITMRLRNNLSAKGFTVRYGVISW